MVPSHDRNQDVGESDFTPDTIFDDLMYLKIFRSTGSMSQPKSLKKPSMMFLVHSYPSRTQSVAKKTHPHSSNLKGKWKLNDSYVDPEFVIDESNTSNEPMPPTRQVKKQGSSKSKVAASLPKTQSSVAAPSKPLTQGSVAKRSNTFTAKFANESDNALSLNLFCEKNMINWDAMSMQRIIG